jgi:hypothetical protein
MNTAQQKHFDALYEQHNNALTRQGKSKVTIESYARSVRRITTAFDKSPVNYYSTTLRTTSPT